MSEEKLESSVELEPETPASADNAESVISALAAECDRLSTEKSALESLLLRRAAEFDNFRKRTDREMAERSEFAAMDAVKALLPVLDDFERALKVETSDKDYAKGVELIYQRFFDQLKKLGLEALEAEGQPFDPNLHNAIDRLVTSEVPDQTVVADLQRGYRFKGRLLRPSMVRVAVQE